MTKQPVTAKSYSLYDDNNQWLGQIILTSDGLYASVTDWGNLSFAWRHYGDVDFREFIIGLDVGYFGGKMYQGISYTAHGKTVEKSCDRYAQKILPALKKVLKAELEAEKIGVPL